MSATALHYSPSHRSENLAPVEQLHLFGAPPPVCLQWCSTSAQFAGWLSFKGAEGESLVQRLVDDVDKFACDANQAISMGRPESISALKKATIEQALAYYDEIGAGRRVVDITAALAVLVDFVRGIELLAHAVLAGSDSQYIVRLSTATGGPRYRNDPPRRALAAKAHADEDSENAEAKPATGRLPLARQSTPYCAYTSARMMFPHGSPTHAADGATSAQIANIWRTTAVSVDNLLERAIGELRSRLDELGYGLDGLQEVFAR